jgi:hypothetical protein
MSSDRLHAHDSESVASPRSTSNPFPKLAKAGAAITAFAAIWLACSSDARFGTNPVSTNVVDPVAPLTDSGIPDAPPITFANCSPDLKNVLDVEGKVIATCSDGQLCGRGGCVSACQGAQDNKSSIGCEYYAPVPEPLMLGRGGCHALFVVNTSDIPAKLTVDRAGKSYNVASFARVPVGLGNKMVFGAVPGGDTLKPGELAVLFMNHKYVAPIDFLGQKIDVNCPTGIQAALEGQEAGLYESGIGDAFRVSSSAPIVAYSIYPFGAATAAQTGASLLLPSSTADNNYIGVNAYQRSKVTEEDAPFMQIIATEDDTKVRIKPVAAMKGGRGVPSAAPGQTVTMTLKRGQYAQVTENDELSGSPIDSNKPVLLVGGNRCMNIGPDRSACDNAHQFIPPVKAMGNRYVAVPHPQRKPNIQEDPPWRLVGVANDTQLTYDPAPPAGAPTSLALGQVVEFNSGSPFVVSSQDANHPFYMSAHMTGGQNEGQPMASTGDPEFVNVIPPAQYLKSYTFLTDQTYPRTQLVLTRVKGTSGFRDVTLECAGSPVTGWKPIGTSGTYEYAYVEIARGNYEKVGNCGNGKHRVTSDGEVGLTVWGWGANDTTPPSRNVSYAYPAGASVRPLTSLYVPAGPN